MTLLTAAALAVPITAVGGPPPIGDGRGGVKKELVTDGFAGPIWTASAPGVTDLVYVVERGGTVQAVDRSDGTKQEFLNISEDVSTGGEGGMWSLAFDPNYQTNNLFYVVYATDGGQEIRLDEFAATSDTEADEASRREVLTVPHPDGPNHYGGTIAFGPDDFLYQTVGDGGGGGGDPNESAQDKESLDGKVLRINPHESGEDPYTIPADNPYVGTAGRDEVYALGLRNPFRASFDAETGRFSIGDVGQNAWEEIDYESATSLPKANFGWDHFEGNHRLRYPGDNESPRPDKNYEPPIHEYSHTSGGNVVIGGLVVRDPELPSLYGRYLYSDFGNFGNHQLRSLVPKLAGAKGDRKLGLKVTRPSSFTAGPDQEVYVTTLVDGQLFRLVPEE